MDQPHLGHKLPRPGYSRLGLYLPCHLNGPSNRYGISPLFCSFLSILLTLRLSWCPACFGNLLTSRHVLQDCVAVEEVRVREGIRTFLNDCKIAGRSSATAYRLYVTGEDAFGSKIATEEHLQRGGCLSRLTDEWLDLWESVTEWMLQNIVRRINCSKVELALLLLCGGFLHKHSCTQGQNCLMVQWIMETLYFYCTGLLLSKVCFIFAFLDPFPRSLTTVVRGALLIWQSSIYYDALYWCQLAIATAPLTKPIL